MKTPRTYGIGVTTNVGGVGVASRRLLTIEAAEGFYGGSEEAAVHEFRVAWRKLQRRIRDLEDAAPSETAR